MVLETSSDRLRRRRSGRDPAALAALLLCNRRGGTARNSLEERQKPARELHWWTLPWPFSQLVLDLSPWALLALTALPVLAVGLVISRTFRWVSLLRTALINLALITLGHLSLDFFPCLLRPAPDNPSHNFLIIPPVVQVLLFFSTFLVAAWLGCISPRHAEESERQAGNSRLIP